MTNRSTKVSRCAGNLDDDRWHVERVRESGDGDSRVYRRNVCELIEQPGRGLSASSGSLVAGSEPEAVSWV